METAVTLGAQALISVFVAVLVAVLSVRLALARYYKEKWWEKKYEAYAAIIDALHHLKTYPGRLLGDHEPDDKERVELEERAAKARAELRRRADIGHLVISTEAVTELANVLKTSEATREITDFYQAVETDYDAVNKALARMRDIARTDLKVPA